MAASFCISTSQDWVPVASHPYPPLELSVLWILANPIAVQWYHIVLICNSLKTYYVDHIFMCLFPIWPSSLARCLFRFFFPFKILACLGNSLVIQWLGLCAFTAERPGSIPDQELRFGKSCSTKQTNKKLFVFLLLRVVCIFWIHVFYQIHALQIFSPSLWLIFPFSQQCLLQSVSFQF